MLRVNLDCFDRRKETELIGSYEGGVLETWPIKETEFKGKKSIDVPSEIVEKVHKRVYSERVTSGKIGGKVLNVYVWP